MPNEIALIPVKDIQAMAVSFAKSNLFGMKTADEAFALMLLAQAEGMHPATAARDYDIIQGRPAKKSEAMLRDFITHGGKVVWHKLDDTIADATFSHPSGGELRISWDMARARAAELGTKPMWKKYPRQMLRARCVSEGIRSVYPAATGGLYVPEEVQDFEPKKPAPIEVKSELHSEPVENDLPIDTAPKPSPIKIKTGAGPDTPEEAPPAKGPSAAQLKMLWASQADNGWQKEQVKEYIYNRWHVDSSLDLTRGEISTLIDILKNKTYAQAAEDLLAFQK